VREGGERGGDLRSRTGRQLRGLALRFRSLRWWFAVCQRDRVHAVAQSRWSRPVVEDMSKMRATTRARNFRSKDRRKSAAFMNSFLADRLPETWPARTGVKFRVGGVERVTARGANVSAGAVFECVTTGRRSLGAGSAHDVELLGGHDELPFVICQTHWLIKRNGVQLCTNSGWIEIARMRTRAGGNHNTDTYN
jgi:hypothetical protein